MSDGYLNFDEYIRQGEPAQRERAEAWRVAIGLQAVFFPIDNTTLLPLRGEFGGHSPIPRTMSSPRTLSLAGRLSPFQGAHAAAQTYNRPEGAASHQPNGNALGIAPKGQPSGNPMATPWATETPWAMVTSSATITPSATATPWATITPVSATNEKCIIAPKGHKQKRYGTISL